MQEFRVSMLAALVSSFDSRVSMLAADLFAALPPPFGDFPPLFGEFSPPKSLVSSFDSRLFVANVTSFEVGFFYVDF
jgi:hypothetical protein